MPYLSVETAIQRARATLALDEMLPAHASYVRRLDLLGKGYYLALFGPEAASIAAAAIDAQTGEIVSHARLSGDRPQLPVSAKDAIKRAGVTPRDPPRLVWQACRASQSMLSPIWEIQTEKGFVYVDQQGHRWTALEPAMPGG